MELKGTVLVLITMIIQIVINVIVFITLPPLGMIMLIDTALIAASYFGFKNGKKGWAIFAVAYGIISMIMTFSQGNVLNISILLLIAGVLALSDK